MAKKQINIRELAVFAMLGSIMFCSKVIMEAIPNVHLLGMFTMTFTLVYRTKALIPIYIYVMLNGLYAGFNMWWVPYLYLWAILWGVTMLLPKKMSERTCYFVYPMVCAFHGLAFGTLYAPAQAWMFGFDWDKTLAWIIAGLPWDAVHALGNLIAGFLIIPLKNLLIKLSKQINII